MGVNSDQFKVAHLKQRISQLTAGYEGQISEYALAVAQLTQERDEAREIARQLQEELDKSSEPTENAEDEG